MTREELIKLINLSDGLVGSGRPNRPGESITPGNITIHNTSNTTPGANAAAHSKFIRETGFYLTPAGKKNWVSWHFTVDDKQAIRHLPTNEKAFHAGAEANNSSLAIEICMHAGINQSAANERAAQLAALLCFDHALSVELVVTHQFWTGKNCPVLLLQNWSAFKQRIGHYLTELKAGADTLALLSDEETTLDQSTVQLCCSADSAAPSLADELTRPPAVQNGFNFTFLSDFRIELPVLSGNHPSASQHLFIHHQNLSIYFNKERKLALYSACNFDKSRFINFDRSNAFQHDQFPESGRQVGEEFYRSKTNDKSRSQNFFDRGHLIARRYNQWGDSREEATIGERDTYYFTTIHPQVGELNQQEWEKLESFIINTGRLAVDRVSILAGAILSPEDPIAEYVDAFTRETQSLAIPVVYWKVVFYLVGDELRKIAFLMSQKNVVSELPMMQPAISALIDPFDLLDEPLKPFIVKSNLIEQATGLTFSPAVELYDREQPLKVVIDENDVDPGFAEMAAILNFGEFI